MTDWIELAIVIALLGSALMGGVFFAFSNFIMPALGRITDPEGIRAMQSINRVVLNRIFLGLFLGTAALSALAAVGAVWIWDGPVQVIVVAGALAYICGTFMLTGMGNVPLNERLDQIDADAPADAAVWSDYLQRWTRLNTIRTIASMIAAALLLIALLVAPRTTPAADPHQDDAPADNSPVVESKNR